MHNRLQYGHKPETTWLAVIWLIIVVVTDAEGITTADPVTGTKVPMSMLKNESAKLRTLGIPAAKMSLTTSVAMSDKLADVHVPVMLTVPAFTYGTITVSCTSGVKQSH
jgi:hypothetical protein